MNTFNFNPLAMAAATSFHFGQKVSSDNSAEKKEKERQDGLMILKVRNRQKANEQTQESGKGFLA